MKILLVIFCVFYFSFSNAQSTIETKSDSTISNYEWQKKVDEKLDQIIDNLTKKNNIVLFSKTTDASKSKQTDSLRNIIDSLEKKIIALENKIQNVSDTLNIRDAKIKNLNSTISQNNKNCKIEKDEKDQEISFCKSQQSNNELFEVSNLVNEINALKDQPYTFSTNILQSMQSRINNLSEEDQKKILNYSVLINFKNAVGILNEANNSLNLIYSSNTALLLKNLDDASILPEFTELFKKKNELKLLLGNYCSTTLEVQKYLNGSEQIPDEETRIIYIKDNAVPEVEDYPFLENLCKNVIKDKNQNILREFSCQ